MLTSTNRIPVASDMMRAIGYDSATAVLVVEFHNGSTYEYFEVPPERYANLLAASSKGRFFNVCIRGAFRFRRTQ